MPKLWEALLTLAILIAALAVGIIIFGVDPHVPMFVGVMAAAIMALHLGYKWDEVEKSMMDGIYKALQSICILIIVGILIGVWINAGVVPTMIYYGLKVLKPAIFFIACVLICSITSLATGTSWGTMGTMGVALMGIGFGLGMSPGMTAGAVLSGAYFGDKMSPLSDTTNLAPAMAGTDVITHVKAMMLPTGITYAITLIFFGVLGVMQYHGGDADMSRVIEVSAEALAMFESPLSPETSYTMTRLLESGGIMGMMSSVSMTIIAMMFGGIMEQTHQLEVIVNALKKFAKGPAALVGLTEVTCVLSNATMPEQYISIVVPGRMYAEEYHKMGVHPSVLSSALEGAGTVTSALIPWNTCGVFIKDTLNIAPWGAGGYGPWAIFNWLMPIINWLCVLIGWTLKDLAGKPFKKSKKVAQ